jgi:hypothetical protein
MDEAGTIFAKLARQQYPDLRSITSSTQAAAWVLLAPATIIERI